MAEDEDSAFHIIFDGYPISNSTNFHSILYVRPTT